MTWNRFSLSIKKINQTNNFLFEYAITAHLNPKKHISKVKYFKQMTI